MYSCLPGYHFGPRYWCCSRGILKNTDTEVLRHIIVNLESWYICVYIYIYVHISIQGLPVYACVYVYVCVGVYEYVCISIYLYIYVYIYPIYIYPLCILSYYHLVLGTDADKLVYIHIDIRVKRDISLRISNLHTDACLYMYLCTHIYTRLAC
jgi:hypothetical protein